MLDRLGRQPDKGSTIFIKARRQLVGLGFDHEPRDRQPELAAIIQGG